MTVNRRKFISVRKKSVGTQAALAERTGLTIQTISRIERGYKFNKSTLNLLAAVLGVSPESLLLKEKAA